MKPFGNVLRLVTAVVVLLACSSALADWYPGDPYKWLQSPDLSVNGVNVKATYPNIVADDFRCNDPRPITDIHIWGSWKNDLKPAQKPTFIIGIWADQPVDGTIFPYSRPRQPYTEYMFEASSYKERLYSEFPPTGTEGEWWYDPLQPLLIPNGDKQVWQYNFHLSDPFPQVPNTIYWLSVQAVGLTGPQFGWKTSINHWNDDAVWGNTATGFPPAWNELRYPDGHPFHPNSMDMAFVIDVPEPASISLLVVLGCAATVVFVSRRLGRNSR